MNCIDLRARFGDRYRLGTDPSLEAERTEFRAEERRWLTTILCRHGEIIPWGGFKLAACTSGAGSIGKRLRALPFVEVAQNGQDGRNVVFDLEHFDEVAEIMQPRRRRRLSPEARAAAGERLRKYQYQPAVGCDSDERQCVPAGGADR